MTVVSDYITSCWEEIGGRKGYPVSEWYSMTEGICPGSTPPQLEAWVEILDEYLCWCVSYVTVLQYILYKQKSTVLCRSFLVIGAAIVSLTASIRQLVLSGHELPSRHLMRCLREYVDLQCILQMNPSLCEQFVKTQDEVSANAFWHRHLSKSKFKKSLNSTDISREAVTEYISWRDCEDKVFAMASHPSFGASAGLVLLPRIGEKPEEIYDWFGFLGICSMSSVRTVEYAIYTLGHYAAICVVPALIPELEEDEFIMELYVHANSGKCILRKLGAWVCDHRDSPELRSVVTPQDSN
jgi:hypothetical protein